MHHQDFDIKIINVNIMEKKRIVKIEEFISINRLWEKEDKDFTPWLKENIDYLTEAIGFELNPEERELPITEGFRIDLVAKDSEGNRIIIENQYKDSNHDHLGKLLVYCISLNAKVGIWICENARQSHIEVIEWLNEFSEGIDFYLIQLKLGKIEDMYIPLFEVISKPSQDSKMIGKTKKEMSETEQLYKEFWIEFLEKANEQTDLFKNIYSPFPQQFLNISAGKRLFYLSNFTKDTIRTELYFNNSKKERNKQYYDELYKNKDEIEKEFGETLQWERLELRKACRIKIEQKGISWLDKKNWDEIHQFFIKYTMKFNEVFGTYIQKL